MNYYLLDVVRTIEKGKAHYLKQNCFEYTTDMKEAGVFEEKQAIELRMNYLGGNAVLIEEKTGKKLARL